MSLTEVGGGAGGHWGESGRPERRPPPLLHPRGRFQVPWLESVPIAVSNNIDEEALARLAQEVGWMRG